MTVPIKIESLENDIIECSKHLDYLKKTSILGKELNEFINDNNFDKKALLDLDISNAHCVTTISQLEISIILKSLFHSKHELEQKQILKNGILIMYESIKSIDKFNKVLKDYSELNPNLQNEFKAYRTEIKQFKGDVSFDRKIKNIRNNIAGHINTDFVEYSKFIDSIEIEKTMNTLIAYRFIINRLKDYLFKCLIL
tara:strand:- start:1215 stop:1805 length:591 start_codon:yes stop_codon:yes gene_type:complete